MRDIEKLEPLTDGLTHFHLIQKTQNTRTQYTSANITLPQQEHFLSAQQRHIDTVILNAIMKKGTRNSSLFTVINNNSLELEYPFSSYSTELY